MPCLQDSALLPPSSILHHQRHDDFSKVTEHLRPERQNKDQRHEHNSELEQLHLQCPGKVSQQQSQQHRKQKSSSIGLIRPLVKLVREPVKTLGELYAESEWAVDNGKRTERTYKRETQILYSKLKQVSQSFFFEELKMSVSVLLFTFLFDFIISHQYRKYYFRY